jgi:hypothetical protein
MRQGRRLGGGVASGCLIRGCLRSWHSEQLACSRDVGRNPLLLEQALAIAENEMVLIRVPAARVAAIERAHDITPKPIELRDELDAMRHAMPDLDRLARYERRAWSGRNRAIRNFMEIKARSNA